MPDRHEEHEGHEDGEPTGVMRLQATAVLMVPGKI